GLGDGPSGEAALRKALLENPKTLSVVGQTLDGLTAARAEDKERSAKRVAGEHLAAQGRQPIDAFTEIHGLDRHQDPHVWSDLDHERRRRNSCTIARRSLGLALGSRSVSRAPEA